MVKEMTSQNDKSTTKANQQQNEKVDSSFSVSELIRDVKEQLGLIIIGEAGHGKSFAAFTLAKEAMRIRTQLLLYCHLLRFGEGNSEL
jgi:DNA replication protein DnaC